MKNYVILVGGEVLLIIYKEKSVMILDSGPEPCCLIKYNIWKFQSRSDR